MELIHKIKWGTEIEYNLIKVCNDGSIIFKDKINKFLPKNEEVSKWLKINTEKTSTVKDKEKKVLDCYDIEAIFGVFEGVDTEDFIKACDFFQTVLDCIQKTRNFNCINYEITKEMILYKHEFTFYGKPQLTISIDIANYPRLFYLYFNNQTKFIYLYNQTFKLMEFTGDADKDLTIFGFILYINYFIYCMNAYILDMYYIVENMLSICENIDIIKKSIDGVLTEEDEEVYTDYISFYKEIKYDQNGLNLIKSIGLIKDIINKRSIDGQVLTEDEVKVYEFHLNLFIIYLGMNESYHYFLKEYIKNKDLFEQLYAIDKSLTKISINKEDEVLIEFYKDLELLKDENFSYFIENRQHFSSNSYILTFIKFQESWSKKNYIKGAFPIKPRTKIEFLWMKMTPEDRKYIKNMVKKKEDSMFSISFKHRNEITTLKTVINRLTKKKKISNFLETYDVYELFEFEYEQNDNYEITIEFRDFKRIKMISQYMNGVSVEEIKTEVMTIEEFKKSINYIFTGFISQLFSPLPPVLLTFSKPRPSPPLPLSKPRTTPPPRTLRPRTSPTPPPLPLSTLRTSPTPRTLRPRTPRPRTSRSRSPNLHVPPSDRRDRDRDAQFKSKKSKTKSKTKSKKSKTKSKTKSKSKSKTKKSKTKSKSKKSKTKSKTKTKKSKTKTKKSKTKTKQYLNQ